MSRYPSRAEAADQLREQAASCRRLARSARTLDGFEALRSQFDADAARDDPVVQQMWDALGNDDAAALIRVRKALHGQVPAGFDRVWRVRLIVRSGARLRVEPAHYREQAQLSRERADRCKDHEISLHLHSVAKQYDTLADEAEKTNR